MREREITRSAVALTQVSAEWRDCFIGRGNIIEEDNKARANRVSIKSSCFTCDERIGVHETEQREKTERTDARRSERRGHSLIRPTNSK